jgi:hypothetical protein
MSLLFLRLLLYTHNTMINPTMMKNNGIPTPRPTINSKLSTTEKLLIMVYQRQDRRSTQNYLQRAVYGLGCHPQNIIWTICYIILNKCKFVRRHVFVIVYLRQKTSLGKIWKKTLY